MKVTQHEGTREVSFHRAMANLFHPHLLKCLASFTFSSQYNMIYEKADCDVEKFMKMNSDPRKLPDMRPNDLAQQLFGLADALSVIHNQGQIDPGNSFNLLVPGSEKPKTGYIHDIKPENLLMFIYDDNGKKTYWFRLSDFSCAKVVDVLTSVSGKNRHSWQTVSKSGTPVYRAPESTAQGRTSRPYDLWSLGCVYLELLVWFLDGYTALINFRDKRECQVTPGGREDEGFYYAPNAGDKFRLREVVLKKMESVSKRCEGSLQEVANVIPQLLQIDPEGRPTAEQLVKSLKHIDSGARPPVEVTSEQHAANGTCALSAPVDISDSDSDSSFGGMVRVQHPTE
ncbi:kinase-like protein [Macroventuria anomochaeta]|uniref:Kinase-like protein n=1 Tax=Macroventuria anomochaeta TaxID=301207 RepID=A0ACB6RTA1_9PLEO|nr:kinase-like protein [Macroventuria anomochaeta]KAF2625281.1 kinase-like protein [Macroventuria anomochaeta]